MDTNRDTAILQAVGVNKIVTAGGTQLQILSDINLTISANESVAIVGMSGAGKSTLLSLLAGMDVASSGSILMNGQNLTAMNEDERAAMRRKRVGFVFQSFHLITHLSALENVLLPLELLGIDNALEKAIDWCSRVGLAHRLNHFPNQLSGGEQQRVAIARAFAIEPKLLFADEPTGNLDEKTAHGVIECLYKLYDESDLTLVFVTHDQILTKYCQKHFHLEEGCLV